jgi:hypothetical protein
MALESELPRGTERAGEGASRLAGDAERRPPWIPHEHRLDGHSVACPEEPLPSGLSICNLFHLDLKRPETGCDCLSQIGWQIGHVMGVEDRGPIEPVADLVDPIVRTVADQVTEVFGGKEVGH